MRFRRFPPTSPTRRCLEDAAFVPRRMTARWRPLPGFLVIGAQRAGTTSLFQCLGRHPELSAAPIKEVHYFDAHYHRGLDWYRAHFPLGRRGIAGEATPYYLFHPAVPWRVRAALPDVRLIAILRNPVERALSHYRHEVRLGFEDAATSSEAVEFEEARLGGETDRLLTDSRALGYSHNHHSYLSRGEYARQLQAWYEHFPREQLLVMSSERLFADPAGELERVMSFLGVAQCDLGAPPHLNAAPGDPADDALRARLKEHFRPHNRELFELLREDLGWGK